MLASKRRWDAAAYKLAGYIVKPSVTSHGESGCGIRIKHRSTKILSVKMQFSQDHEAVLGTKHFKATPVKAMVQETLLKNSQDYLAACKLLQPNFPMPAFSAAYEGLSQLCHALYEHYDVQVGTDSAMQVICRELGMNDSDRSFIRATQERRSETSYQYPAPSALTYGTKTLIRLVETYTPIARNILNLPS